MSAEGVPQWQLIVAGTVGTAVAVGSIYLLWTVYSQEHDQEHVSASASTSTARSAASGGSRVSFASAVKGGAGEVTTAGSDEERREEAMRIKKKGNEAYTRKDYANALQLYTQAIDLYPDQDKSSAVFYCNRAACHLFLDNPRAVVEDCTRALQLNCEYIKAFSRRAQAYERLYKPKDALVDYTMVCNLESYAKESSTIAAERVLGKMAAEQAEKYIANRQPSLPAIGIVRMYLRGFKPIWEPETESVATLQGLIADDDKDGWLRFRLALAYIENSDFEKVRDSASAAADLLKPQAEESDDIKAKYILALNLLGTFHHLYGELKEALAAYNEILSIDPQHSNTLIKRGDTHLERLDMQSALADCDAAIKAAPDNFDGYYHRGQIYLVSNDPRTLDDARKCAELPSSTPLPLIQLAFAYMKENKTGDCKKVMKDVLGKYPNDADVYCYCAQATMEFREFVQVKEYLAKALEIDQQNAQAHVQYGLLLIAAFNKQDEGLAEIKTAIKVDPKCELAYEHLAQQALATQNYASAAKYAEDIVGLSRNQRQAERAYSLKLAAEAQAGAVKLVATLTAARQ